jgi:hypothetical protein
LFSLRHNAGTQRIYGNRFRWPFIGKSAMNIGRTSPATHESLTAFGQQSPHNDGARIMARNLSYVLPRAVLVLLCWGATYWILTALSPSLPPSVVYITGISWVLAGIVCFGYIYNLRRELNMLPHQQRPATAQPTTSQPAAPPATARERFYAALPPNR